MSVRRGKDFTKGKLYTDKDITFREYNILRIDKNIFRKTKEEKKALKAMITKLGKIKSKDLTSLKA